MAGERDDETPEAINREQQDEGQAQDVAAEALRPGRPLGDSRPAPGDPNRILPDDVPDLVDTMTAMVASGVIDNGAFAGEPQHDDEEDMLGETDSDDEDDELRNALADGSEDPLAVPVDLDDLADDGDDPLGRAASEHGLEDEDSDDDDDDYDDADDDDLADEDDPEEEDEEDDPDGDDPADPDDESDGGRLR